MGISAGGPAALPVVQKRSNDIFLFLSLVSDTPRSLGSPKCNFPERKITVLKLNLSLKILLKLNQRSLRIPAMRSAIIGKLHHHKPSVRSPLGWHPIAPATNPSQIDGSDAYHNNRENHGDKYNRKGIFLIGIPAAFFRFFCQKNFPPSSLLQPALAASRIC